MNLAIAGLLFFLSCSAASAQTGQASGGTVPVMVAPPTSGVGLQSQSQNSAQTTPAQAAPHEPPETMTPHVVITKPIPESEIQPRIVPRADTPADQAIRKDADEAIATQAEQISDACDTTIKARIDWTTIGAQEINQNSPANSCGAALEAIKEICATSAARDRVEKEIATVICTAGPQPAVELHGGTLLYTLDWQSRNPGSFVYAWLAGHL